MARLCYFTKLDHFLSLNSKERKGSYLPSGNTAFLFHHSSSFGCHDDTKKKNQMKQEERE